jgi:apolipoprotein N-acyltransferase
MDYCRFGMPDFNVIPRRDYLLAVVSGALFALSFPKPGLWPLAWVAFIPLFLACRHKNPAKSFRLGFVTGLAGFGGVLYWINIVVTKYGHLPWWVSVFVFLMLVAYLSLYPAMAACLTRWAEERGVTPLLCFPLAWTSLEYLRSFALTGFPWATLGYSPYRVLPLIQVADITGVYGLSFLIAFANVVLFQGLRRMVRGEPYSWPLKSGVLLVVLVGATVGYGSHRIHQPQDGATLKVALIQGNIPQDVKWDPSFQEATIGIYERLTRQAAATGRLDLIVWPESAAPFFVQDEPRLASRIGALARQARAGMIVGSPAYERNGDRMRYLNSAFFFTPAGDVGPRSDKLHLVPFGEYVPLAKLLPFVNKMVTGIGDFVPGSNYVTFPTGKGDAGVLVCFEGIFPELARGYVRQGSRVLVNITNDAWFGRSSAPWQHLSMYALRAVENRVPVVRAANTGISSLIDSTGRITDTTTLFQEAVLTGDVRLANKVTFYTRYGDVFIHLVCSAFVVVLVVAARRRKGRGNLIHKGVTI